MRIYIRSYDDEIMTSADIPDSAAWPIKFFITESEKGCSAFLIDNPQLEVYIKDLHTNKDWTAEEIRDGRIQFQTPEDFLKTFCKNNGNLFVKRKSIKEFEQAASMFKVYGKDFLIEHFPILCNTKAEFTPFAGKVHKLLSEPCFTGFTTIVKNEYTDEEGIAAEILTNMVNHIATDCIKQFLIDYAIKNSINAAEKDLWSIKSMGILVSSYDIDLNFDYEDGWDNEEDDVEYGMTDAYLYFLDDNDKQVLSEIANSSKNISQTSICRKAQVNAMYKYFVSVGMLRE